jgi:ubiquinone/menaquinone biosynthesis C-methylase UbiE
MQIYNRVFRPGLFDPWAAFLVDELRIGPSEHVLDVSCGPGTVAEAVARRVGPAGRVVGVDLSPAMLAIARDGDAGTGAATIEYIEASADHMPVADEAFDAVTCQQGLQFYPDRAGALTEMHRALVPGGRIGIAVWTAIDESPPFGALAGALDELDPQLGALYRSGPWSLTSAQELRGLVEGAGFSDARVERHTLPWRIAGGPAALLSTLGAAAVATDVAALDEARHAALADALDRRVSSLVTGDDIVSNSTTFIVVATR